jgi:hypothetical protein
LTISLLRSSDYKEDPNPNHFIHTQLQDRDNL